MRVLATVLVYVTVVTCNGMCKLIYPVLYPVLAFLLVECRMMTKLECHLIGSPSSTEYKYVLLHSKSVRDMTSELLLCFFLRHQIRHLLLASRLFARGLGTTLAMDRYGWFCRMHVRASSEESPHCMSMGELTLHFGISWITTSLCSHCAFEMFIVENQRKSVKGQHNVESTEEEPTCSPLHHRGFQGQRCPLSMPRNSRYAQYIR
jgi:hypothetical protein